MVDLDIDYVSDAYFWWLLWILKQNRM